MYPFNNGTIMQNYCPAVVCGRCFSVVLFSFVFICIATLQVQLSLHPLHGYEWILQLPKLVRQPSLVSSGQNRWRHGEWHPCSTQHTWGILALYAFIINLSLIWKWNRAKSFDVVSGSIQSYTLSIRLILDLGRTLNVIKNLCVSHNILCLQRQLNKQITCTNHLISRACAPQWFQALFHTHM